MSLGAVNGAVTLPIPLPPPIAGALQVGPSSPSFPLLNRMCRGLLLIHAPVSRSMLEPLNFQKYECEFVQGGLLGNLLGAAGVKVDSADERRRITVDGAFAALLRS